MTLIHCFKESTLMGENLPKLSEWPDGHYSALRTRSYSANITK